MLLPQDELKPDFIGHIEQQYRVEILVATYWHERWMHRRSQDEHIDRPIHIDISRAQRLLGPAHIESSIWLALRCPISYWCRCCPGYKGFMPAHSQRLADKARLHPCWRRLLPVRPWAVNNVQSSHIDNYYADSVAGIASISTYRRHQNGKTKDSNTDWHSNMLSNELIGMICDAIVVLVPPSPVQLRRRK